MCRYRSRVSHSRYRPSVCCYMNAICVMMWFWCTKGMPRGEGGVLFRKAEKGGNAEKGE